MKKLTFLIAITPIFLAGCANTLNTAENSEFSCKSDVGVVCKTPIAIYQSTHGSLPVTERDRPINQAQPGESVAKVLVANLSSQEEIDKPVRLPPTVMRIWINRWISKNDDLHLEQRIFTEVQPRRWAVGQNEASKDMRPAIWSEPQVRAQQPSPYRPDRSAATAVVPRSQQVTPPANVPPAPGGSGQAPGASETPKTIDLE